MKKVLLGIALVIAAAMSAKAETANVTGQFCGPLTANLNCQQLSLSDGGKVSFEPFYNPTPLYAGYNALNFSLADANFGQAHPSQVFINGTNVCGNCGPGPSNNITSSINAPVCKASTVGAVGPENTILTLFDGHTLDTGTHYAGSIQLQMHTLCGYHSGRDAGYRNSWTVDSGSTDISPDTQTAEAPKPGKFESLVLDSSRHRMPELLRVDTGAGPPSSVCPSGNYYASQPCGPAYQCGNNQYCQCWKAYCEITEEYGIYQWVYWQRHW